MTQIDMRGSCHSMEELNHCFAVGSVLTPAVDTDGEPIAVAAGDDEAADETPAVIIIWQLPLHGHWPPEEIGSEENRAKDE